MNLLDLLPGETMKRVGSMNGGEYHGPCPWCAGKDRFIVWPEHPGKARGGRYWCRRCHMSGDAIEFLKVRQGMTYREACHALGVSSAGNAPRSPRRRVSVPRIVTPADWKPEPARLLPHQWQERAERFVAECLKRMIPGSTGMNYALSRHLTTETVSRLCIGWNPTDRWEDRKLWGLPFELNKNGRPAKVWMAEGLVIPTYGRMGLQAVKVRRSRWNADDKWPKYAALAASVAGMPLFDGTGRPIVVVESELDAVLLWQEVGDLVDALALGSAGNRPNQETATLLRTAPRILVALDNDTAGMEESVWWEMTFPKVLRWPPLGGKDIGDMAKYPGRIRDWVEVGLSWDGSKSAGILAINS